MKIAGKAILALALMGSGGVVGFHFGRTWGLPEASPSVVIDGPSAARPGDILTFKGDRSASASPLEWWRDGQLVATGNEYQAKDVPPGPLVVTAVGFGNGRHPSHTLVSKLVDVAVTPGPTPPPGPNPGPTPPPPGPTPTPQVKVKWAVVLYDPAASDPQIAAIRSDGNLRKALQAKGISFYCFDATDDAVKAKFAGYFRAGIPALPSLLLLGETSQNPPYVGPMPPSSAAIQALVSQHAP